MIKFPRKDNEIRYTGMQMSIYGGTVECTATCKDAEDLPRKLGLMIIWVQEKLDLAKADLKSLTITKKDFTLHLKLKMGEAQSGRRYTES